MAIARRCGFGKKIILGDNSMKNCEAIAKIMTDAGSDIKAGHIYYWDGWNAFVINFEDYDISPYKVVHIGEIKSEDISDILKNSGEIIDIEVR